MHASTKDHTAYCRRRDRRVGGDSSEALAGHAGSSFTHFVLTRLPGQGGAREGPAGPGLLYSTL
jgi:hypothetical protein